ncbi:MAG TPA: FG-GAP-like repeat-containing protein [Cyclobacteriaceae bacterium]|nr:FG-GAP-like repeat-containing protein [Cyclobacteriaceae bacterium]
MNIRRLTFVFSIVCGLFLATTALAQPFVRSLVVSMGGNYGTPSMGDYDGDGDMDVLLVGQEKNNNTGLHLYKLTDKTFEEVLNSGLPQRVSGGRFVDYENDGDLDLFITFFEVDNRVGYFYINNNGKFTRKENNLPRYPGNTLYSPVDCDNDGDTDVVVIGGPAQGQSRATLYKNENGVFTAIPVSGIPYDSFELYWADIDNDNDLDLFSISQVGTGIYENVNGDFRTQVAIVKSLNGGTRQIVDYDGDNDKDVIVGGYNSVSATNELLVYVNNGNKTFTETTLTIPGLIQTGKATFVDYDGDGDLDVFNNGTTGSPTFTFFSEFFTKSPSGYTKVDNPGMPGYQVTQYGFVDYDGDDDLDVFIGSANGKTVLYRNNYFKDDLAPRDDQPGWPIGLVAHPATPTSIVLTYSDFEDSEDGWYIEIQRGTNASFEPLTTLSPNINMYEVTSLSADVRYGFRIRGRNSAGYGKYSQTVYGYTASTALAKTTLTPTVLSYETSKWVDVDTDGDLDLVTGGQGFSVDNYVGKLTIYRNDGGTLSTQAHNIPDISVHDMDWTDFDLDGDMDVLMSGNIMAENNYIAVSKIFVNNGSFSFSEHPAKILGVRSSVSRWIDINTDGYPDIFVSGTQDTNSTVHGNQVLISNKGLTFTESTNHGIRVYYQCDMATADFNGDGRMDIALTGLIKLLASQGVGVATQVYLNQPGGAFKLAQTLPATSYQPSIAAGDLDNDGDPDLIVAGDGQPTYIYWNNGESWEEDTSNVFTEMNDADIQLGDFNKDGSLDITMGGTSILAGRVSAIFLNNGSGVFTASNHPVMKASDPEYAFGDVDGDNDLDLFESGINGNTGNLAASLVKNNTPGANNKPGNPVIVKAEQQGGAIVVEWTNGPDESATLTSNIYVKTPDGKYLYNSISNISNGALRNVSPGNMSYNRKAAVGNLSIGQYEIGVQNIDNSFIGSGFVTTSVTTVNVAPQLISAALACKNEKIRLEAMGNDITWYKESTLATVLKAGNVYEFQMGDSDLKLYVTQKFGSTQSPALEVNVKVYSPVTSGITATNDGLLAPEGTTYQWSRNDSLLVGATSRTLIASRYGKYRLKVTNGPCITDTLSYMIRPPKPTVSLTSQLCTGDAQTVTATGKDIAWYNRAGVKIGSTNTLKINSLTTADTVVFVTQTINQGESLKQPARWKTYSYPGKQITMGTGGKIIAPEGLTYQWRAADGSAIAGATSRELTPTGDGVFSVTVSNGSCKTTSDPLVYTGLEESQLLMVGYDQDTESLIIECGDKKINKVTVYDMTGKLILSDEQQPSRSYSLRGIKAGVYITTLYLDDNTISKKKFLKL